MKAYFINNNESFAIDRCYFLKERNTKNKMVKAICLKTGWNYTFEQNREVRRVG